MTVADEDLLIGIGSIAWLFNIDRLPGDVSTPTSEPAVVSDPEVVESLTLGMNEKASLSSEELNAGMDESKSPTKEDILISKYSYPGTYQAASVNVKKPETACKPADEKKTVKLDPTLDFTTLLIAKPLPFQFSLTPRTGARAQQARSLFQEGVERGDYTGNREFWGADQGKNQPLGWGKV